MFATAALTIALAAATAAVGFRSEVTGKPEHVGQCFDTRVWKKGFRVNDPSFGDAVYFRDNHQIISEEVVPAIRHSRPGDPVHLCVTDLPQNCPADDHAGIGYKVKNLRTGETYEGGDFSHTC